MDTRTVSIICIVIEDVHTPVQSYLVYLVQRRGVVKSLVVGIRGQKTYGLYNIYHVYLVRITSALDMMLTKSCMSSTRF